jgi:osmotically-inducible protein OsmY
LCSLVACAAGPRKSEAQQQADNQTAVRVQAALDADKRLFARHIIVQADNRSVRLSGYVFDSTELYEANSVAKSVAGVSRVVNELELERNGSSNSGSSGR